MGNHRKKKHHRRIVIAAVAVGAVGVPSAAMACGGWPDSGENQAFTAQRTAVKETGNESDGGRGWKDNWHHRHNHHEHNRSTAEAPKTPAASASAPTTTAPKPRHTPKTPTASASAQTTTAPKSTHTTSPSTPKASASAAPTPASTPKTTAPASGAVARIVQLVNAERSQVGCSPVTLNSTLTKTAQAHSADMAAHQNMSHTGSDGSSPGSRITSSGYSWSTYGENVAYGYATPDQVMAGWMSSAGHRANILNCAFKEIGVGLAQPDNYWTQDFGTAR
ncbi:CAP domain-containing protein [Streptomyces sp. NPDC005917]|uniref:CAP domain-containing protein n=1 Tax=unclassified Streptomyces TaxID=2593676 RepID=UPI0033C7AF83